MRQRALGLVMLALGLLVAYLAIYQPYMAARRGRDEADVVAEGDDHLPVRYRDGAAVPAARPARDGFARHARRAERLRVAARHPARGARPDAIPVAQRLRRARRRRLTG